MAYKRKEWYDHVVEFPNRFQETNLGNGLVNEVPAPGEIIQQGTPQSASNFNNIEEGVVAANEYDDYLYLLVKQQGRQLNTAAGEYGTIALPNTQTYPFNSSGVTVPLAIPRDTTNYFVDIEVVSETGGSSGSVTVYNKLLNGFGLKFNGSASSVTVHYKVTGGSV